MAEIKTQVEALRKGSRVAADWFCRSFYRWLEVQLVREGVPTDQSQDVLQHTLLRACLAIQEDAFTYQGQGKLLSWLRTIALNRIKDGARRRGKQPSLLGATDTQGSWAEVVSRTTHGLATGIAREEEWQILREARARFDDEDGMIVALRFDHALPWELVGLEVERTADAARMRCNDYIMPALGRWMAAIKRERQEGAAG